MKKTIEVSINCYHCSPFQFEDALNQLDEIFKEYDTEELDCVQWPDFWPQGNVTVEILDIPEEKMDWAYEKIEEAMQDIESWNIE
jgi:hypothetical protein